MNFTNDDDLLLIEPGKYEVVIDKIEKKQYQVKATGANKIGVNITFKIRDDVEQRFKNSRVWEFLFEANESTPDNWWFDTKKLSKMVRVCLEPTSVVDGKPQWSFTDADTCIQDLTGKPLVIYVDKEFDDRSGSDRNVVKYLSYEKTTKPITATATVGLNGGFTVTDTPVDTNELPF